MDRLKPVAQVVYPFPALTPDLLDLARWMAAYYAAPLDSVIEAMIPAAVRRGARVKEERFLRGRHARSSGEELAALARRAPAQARLYAFLEGQIRPQPKGLILSRTGDVGLGRARARRARDSCARTRRGSSARRYADDLARGELVAAQPHALNAEQAAAVAALAGPLAAGKFGGDAPPRDHGVGQDGGLPARDPGRPRVGRRGDPPRARGRAHPADRRAPALEARGHRPGAPVRRLAQPPGRGRAPRRLAGAGLGRGPDRRRRPLRGLRPGAQPAPRRRRRGARARLQAGREPPLPRPRRRRHAGEALRRPLPARLGHPLARELRQRPRREVRAPPAHRARRLPQPPLVHRRRHAHRGGAPARGGGAVAPPRGRHAGAVRPRRADHPLHQPPRLFVVDAVPQVRVRRGVPPLQRLDDLPPDPTRRCAATCAASSARPRCAARNAGRPTSAGAASEPSAWRRRSGGCFPGRGSSGWTPTR